MGGLLGGLIGGAGSIIGAEKGAKASLTGFNYLKGSPVGKQYLPTGASANNAIADLLGVGGDPIAANNAFQNYNKSTGYDFQLQEGQRAITTNAASRGLINSGATLKALTKYGQNLGSTSFNNYLTQLGGLSSAGLQAGRAIGDAGSAGGQSAGQALQGGYSSAGGQFGGAVSSIFGP